MRLQPATIVLGDQQWQVRPLTLAQVQAIEPLVFAAAEAKGASVAGAIAILRIALSRDHAEDAANLDTIEAGAPEIGAAMAQVLRLGGFVPNGDAAPGEVQAGPSRAADRPAAAPLAAAPIASTGPGSTPG